MPTSSSIARYIAASLIMVSGTSWFSRHACAGVVGGGGAIEWREEDGGNGHFYEAILSPTRVTWEQARDLAVTLGGHLVTLTSSAEDSFVFSLIANRPELWQSNSFGGPWLGGFVFDRFGGYAWLYLVSSGLGLLAAVIACTVRPNGGRLVPQMA